MFIKMLVHQKKKWFFLLLFLFLAIPLWLFEAPEASAHPSSGGPTAIQHAHAQSKAFRLDRYRYAVVPT